jgi:hypothetical protein
MACVLARFMLDRADSGLTCSRTETVDGRPEVVGPRLGPSEPDNDVVVIRHTVGGDALGPDDQKPDGLRRYTRSQSATLSNFPRNPPRYWVCFLASGGRGSRLLVVFENFGEVVEERTDEHRFYDLRETAVLSSLLGRLVIEWGKDAINWSKSGTSAAHLPVVQIADPDAVPFPGFDSVLLSHAELQTVMGDPQYAIWRTALGSVQAST